MTIILNGRPVDLPGPLTVSELLDLLSLPTERIAIELNRKVLRKRDWLTSRVSDSDRIEIVHFVGGG